MPRLDLGTAAIGAIILAAIAGGLVAGEETFEGALEAGAGDAANAADHLVPGTGGLVPIPRGLSADDVEEQRWGAHGPRKPLLDYVGPPFNGGGEILGAGKGWPRWHDVYSTTHKEAPWSNALERPPASGEFDLAAGSDGLLKGNVIRLATYLERFEGFIKGQGYYPQVNSWWRPPVLNRAVKGAASSRHLDAAAVDLAVIQPGTGKRMSPELAADILGYCLHGEQTVRWRDGERPKSSVDHWKHQVIVYGRFIHFGLANRMPLKYRT